MLMAAGALYLLEVVVTPEERFWSRVDKTGDCWLWRGAIGAKDGYGRTDFEGRLRVVHRVAYQLEHGRIPDGLLVDHLCYVRHCVNPSHLRLATRKQNAENRAGADRDSKSGIRGVYPYRGQWAVSVRHNGRHYWGGSYRELAEAEEAAAALRNRLFTHNDGDRHDAVA